MLKNAPFYCFLQISVISLFFLSCQENGQNQTSLKVEAISETAILTKPALPKIDSSGETIQTRFSVPEGFERTHSKEGSFGAFLQNFPLQPAGTKVTLYNGENKYRQDVHAAVLDIDVGKRDLQQCADAIMRLRAEYLWQTDQKNQITFNFTNGFPAKYARWRNGERIRVSGNNVSWTSSRSANDSYETFRSYLNMVFAYAGTLSLAKELNPKSLSEIEIGDVLIQGGSPGHAIIVVDKAENAASGETLILLAQSYMPAQSIHVLKNWQNKNLSPWYNLADFDNQIQTPEWRFYKEDLSSF